MIGVTLSSPKFSALAVEAKDRFIRHTGLPCVLLECPGESNYLVKLELCRMFNQTVVFFDADLWFIQDFDFSVFNDQKEFIAVADPGVYDQNHFPFHDTKTLGLKIDQYFNSGFMIWNNRHKPVFDEAARIAKANPKLKDFGEQSSLNAAVQRGSTLRLISNTFNYIPFAATHKLQNMVRQENPTAIHAAGFGLELKHEALSFYANHFTNKFPL